MIDLRPFLDPATMNQRISPKIRAPLGMILATGSVLCFTFAVDTVRNWGERPHPLFELLFFAITGIASGLVAVKLFRGKPLAKPVQAPPGARFVRVLGFPIFAVCSVLTLIAEDWSERLKFGAMALGGLGFMLWPRRFLPGNPDHGA